MSPVLYFVSSVDIGPCVEQHVHGSNMPFLAGEMKRGPTILKHACKPQMWRINTLPYEVVPSDCRSPVMLRDQNQYIGHTPYQEH